MAHKWNVVSWIEAISIPGEGPPGHAIPMHLCGAWEVQTLFGQHPPHLPEPNSVSILSKGSPRDSYTHRTDLPDSRGGGRSSGL